MNRFLSSAAAMLASMMLLLTPTAHAMEALWMGTPPVYSASDARLTVDVPQEAPVGGTVKFSCSLESRREQLGAWAQLRVVDETGANVASSELLVDLYRGPNAIIFDLETSGLAVGKYLAGVSVQYSERYEPAEVKIPIRRVSSEAFAASLSNLDARIEELATLRGDLPLDARTSLCREVVMQARAAFQSGDWPSVASKVDYLEEATGRIAAGMVFGDSAGPGAVLAPMPSQQVALGPQGFQMDGASAFPLGLALNSIEPSGLDRARRLGCMWVTVDVGPNIVFPGGDTNAPQLAPVTSFLARARELGFAVTLRVRPDQLGEAFLTRHPEIQAKGFVDIAHPDARLILEKHLAVLLPALEASGVAAVELMAAPRFQFEEERFRQLFVSHIERAYPDRIDLNRAWHSHLAEYSEITIKGEFDYSYQNRRAFQYDWQSFHRELALQYVTWAAEKARALTPSLPIFATLSNDMFTKGAARVEPNREQVMQHLAASGQTAVIGLGSGVYALDYPGDSAVVSLTRSLANEHPVFISDCQLGTMDALPQGETVYEIARAALWDLYVSGADAVALSSTSPWLDDPRALEAVLTARSELNAWSGVIQSFHDDPIDIGILFSNSSQIFDDGDPHLESARFAYEGASFSGYKVGFISEGQCVGGALEKLPVLIIPDTPAVSDEAFHALDEHVQNGAAVARTGRPIPYNERGISRHDVVRNTGNTVLVRGLNLPTEYLHAMDAHIDRGSLPRIPRPINGFGFPLEGVRSRFTLVDGQPYLYLVNFRKEAIDCYLAGSMQTGEDVLTRQKVSFPRQILPLQPMLIALDAQTNSATVTASAN